MNLHRSSRMPFLLAFLLVLATSPAPAADYEQAMSYYKSGKYLESAAEFQALVDDSPSYDFGFYMLGLSLTQVRKPADAEENFLKAIELNGDKFEYHHALAKSYYDRRMFSKAVATLNTAQGLAADDRMKLALHSLRGYSLAAQEKWAEAIDDLEKARRLKSDPTTTIQLGKAYLSLGHNDKAVGLLREGLKANPSDAQTHYLLAESLLNLGAEATDDAKKKAYYSEAVSEADAFQRLEPSSVDARYLVGRAALGAGVYDKAIQSFNAVIGAKPDHCNAMANLAKAQIAKEDFGNALASLNNATICAPRMGVAWESKGFVLQKQKKYDEAIVAYSQALKIKPSASIQAAIDTCKQNIEVLAHNKQMDAVEAENEQAKIAEEQRLEEERRKREQWEKKRGD